FYSAIGVPKPARSARSNAAPEQFRPPDQLLPATPDPGQPHGSVSMGGAYPRSDPLVLALRQDHLHVAGSCHRSTYQAMDVICRRTADDGAKHGRRMHMPTGQISAGWKAIDCSCLPL